MKKKHIIRYLIGFFSLLTGFSGIFGLSVVTKKRLIYFLICVVFLCIGVCLFVKPILEKMLSKSKENQTREVLVSQNNEEIKNCIEQKNIETNIENQNNKEINPAKLNIEKTKNSETKQISSTSLTNEQKIKAGEEIRIKNIELKKNEFDNLLHSIPRVKINIDLNAPKQNINIKDYYIEYTPFRKNTLINRLTDFVVIDVETTGLHPGTGKIIQLAAIHFDNFRPVSMFSTYINPMIHIPEEATAINGITDDMVSDSPSFESILPDLKNFLGASNLVGHNLIFDIKFLRKFGFDNEKEKRCYFDTLEISRSKDIYSSDHKLTSACNYNGIFFREAHSAEYDALAAGLLFVAYIWKYVDIKDGKDNFDLPYFDQIEKIF